MKQKSETVKPAASEMGEHTRLTLNREVVKEELMLKVKQEAEPVQLTERYRSCAKPKEIKNELNRNKGKEFKREYRELCIVLHDCMIRHRSHTVLTDHNVLKKCKLNKVKGTTIKKEGETVKITNRDIGCENPRNIRNKINMDENNKCKKQHTELRIVLKDCMVKDKKDTVPLQHNFLNCELSVKINSGKQKKPSSTAQNHNRHKEKPYKCALYPKSFGWPTILTEHSYTNTFDKPYKCDKCSKSFIWPKTLSVHRYTHMGQEP